MTQKNSFKGYTLTFTPQARRELKKLETSIAKKVDSKLQELVAGVANLDIKKMQGIEETYRLRLGDYRIIFEVNKQIVTILVITIAHRKEVYKDY